jgi:hypothetical protein
MRTDRMKNTLMSLDIGNGNTKAVINGAMPYAMPSYILPIHNDIDAPDAGYVTYVRGDRPDLTGASWLAGSAAYEQSPTGYDAVNRDALGKLDKALQMLLGVLSYQQPTGADIQLVCSIHLMELAPDVTTRLQGRHVVRFNRSAVEHTINVKVLKVAPEGFGAVYEHRLTEGTNVVADLGNGTVITTVYGSKGRIVARDVQTGGFEDLVSRVARDSELVLAIGEQGNADRVRRAFEDGSYTYGNTGYDLRPLVRKHLQPWAQASIAKSLSFARTHKADANKAIAIGGGLMLAPVQALFEKYGVTPAKDPVFCSAKGLYRLAQQLSA